METTKDQQGVELDEARIADLKHEKAQLSAKILELKSESAKIASELARAGVSDVVSCW